MKSKTVRMECVVSASLWLLSGLCVAVGTIFLATGRWEITMALYAHAVPLTAGATVTTIRAHMDNNTRLLLDGLKVAGLNAGTLRRVDN